MKQWISQRRDWLTSVVAGLALALAIAALVVGLSADGGRPDGLGPGGTPPFANGSPPQGQFAPGGMPPGAQVTPGYPDGEGSGQGG
jgi:hypothetical protein